MAVKVEINTQLLDAAEGQSLFDCAEAVKVPVPTSCHKQGKCRECLVEVVEGMEYLSPPTEEEKHLEENFRLSCRTHVLGDTGQVRCHTMRRAQMRIADHGHEELASIELQPAVTREGKRILLDGKEIAQSTEPIHGLAIDIGTTTVVVRLYNLETAELVDSQSFENPQRFGGSDVMARIFYDTHHKGRLLQRTLLGYLNHAIAAFDIDSQSIYEVVVAGNSTMRDIFFGLDVYSIGQKPYHSIIQDEFEAGTRDSTSLTLAARKLRLPIHPQARVYGLPIISGHVGADTAACLLAIDLAQEDRLIALMDIGTNTELILGNKDKIYAASCPAGPAFEGGKLSCGMPGLDGAIEKIKIDADGNLTTEVIGQHKPEGICGSGLVELLSELLRIGQMDNFGRYDDDLEDYIVDAEHHIHVHESDINELAQAKGANVAGLRIVLQQYGIGYDQVERFYLAGGFGRHLNLDAARRIGLIPNLEDGKIIQIGNAAIEGAALALLSVNKRRQLEELVKTIFHVELETDPDFFHHFTEGCQFKPVEATLCPH